MTDRSDAIAGLGPVHPGEVLSEDVFPETGLTKTEFAKRLGMSREALHNIFTGKSAVTPFVALKLGRLLGTSPEMWLNLQQAYDLAMVRGEKGEEIDKVERLAA
ncbi:MAG: HigA family addiction module antitoxin [Altererythrobacter sp.]